MLKNPSLLATLIALTLFSACKKDNDNPATSTSLVKTYTEEIHSTGYNVTVSYSLSYDGNNRLISMAGLPDPSGVKYIYNYTSGNSYTMDLYYSNTLNIHEQFWLNPFSLFDSTFQYNNTGDSSTEKYIYNSSKQLVQKRFYNYTISGSVLETKTDYTYDNTGNLTMENDNQGGAISYTYYTDLPYSLNVGQEFFPAPKYFIKTTSNSANGGMVTATHFYSFDNSNRLIKDSASLTGNSGTIIVKSYGY